MNEFIKERNRAFETGDLNWARSIVPYEASDEVIEIAFHKARYECTHVSDARRLESQKWLVERNMRRMTGEQIALGDPLPGTGGDMTRTDRRLTTRRYRLCAKIGMTQAQTARALGVSREAVRQYAKKWGIEFRSGKPPGSRDRNRGAESSSGQSDGEPCVIDENGIR